MNQIKKCTGCKYLEHRWCSALDGPFIVKICPYTGRSRTVPVEGSVFRPRIIDMRAEDGKCGPEAKLYSPSLMTILLQKMYQLFTRS